MQLATRGRRFRNPGARCRIGHASRGQGRQTCSSQDQEAEISGGKAHESRIPPVKGTARSPSPRKPFLSPEQVIHLETLQLFAGLIGVGVFAQWLASRLKIPAIILFLAFGLILGPVLGWLRPQQIFGDLLSPMISLAVGLILFEGGLSLKFHEVKRLGRPLLRLIVGGLVLSFGLTTLAAHFLAGFSWATASVTGAILVVTGPTVIKPLLRQAGLHRRPARLLKWEGIVNDPFGAILAVLALEASLFFSEGAESLHYHPFSIPFRLLGSIVIGCFTAWFLAKAMDRRWIPEHLKAPGILAAVVIVFAASDLLFPEAGLLAVTFMGIVFANLDSANVEDVRKFKEEIATLLVPMLFLVLSSKLQWQALAGLSLGAFSFILAVIFVIRPLSIGTALWNSGLPKADRLLIAWIAPRGIVAAAVAGAFEPKLTAAGYQDAEFLVPVMFAIVLLTVLLHGLSIRPLAQKLGLASKQGDGLLLVGCSRWSIHFASTLQQAGCPVVMVDQNWRDASQARLAGLEVYYGDVLNEEVLDDLPLERLGWALTATTDDAYNALASRQLTKVVGREQSLQLPPHDAAFAEKAEKHLLGTVVWPAKASYPNLAARYWSGDRLKSTKLSENYPWTTFRADHPNALVFFLVRDGRLEPLTTETEVPPEGRLVYLAEKNPPAPRNQP